MSNLSREPLQIVEIDVDSCSLTYGTGACTAVLGTSGTRKCFNTYKTCQDTANFAATTLTLRFAKNQGGLPKGTLVFPALMSVSTNPTQITLGATDDRLGTLGKRARVKVKLRDFTYHDRDIDKYAAERESGAAQSSGVGYDVAEQGTFFGRLRSRWPYYYGRALRVRNGYVGDSIASMPTRHYIITEWAGPDAQGNIEITAQDPLKLADEEFAQCPNPTQGVIETSLTAATTGAVNLLPAGIGSEYEASGKISIGSEIMSFTRSGDVLTITERGTDGTEAKAHSAESTVQQCYEVVDGLLDEVAADLLENFAGVSASFLPTTDWSAEIGRWLATLRLNRVIAKPTSVKKLLSEMADFGVMFWWDEVAQEIKLRANRVVDLDETINEFNDATTVIKDSINRVDLDEQRVSQVWFAHGVLDYSDSLDQIENYEYLYAATDLDAESTVEYAQSRIHIIYSPWLGVDGDQTIAKAVADRLLNRYRDTPQQITFSADIKDRSTLEIAALIQLQTRVLQDETGASLAQQMQVTSVEETDPGHRIKVTAQSYQFIGRFGFIAENGRSDYDASTATEIAEGTYIVDETTLEFPDGTGPYLIF